MPNQNQLYLIVIRGGAALNKMAIVIPSKIMLFVAIWSLTYQNVYITPSNCLIQYEVASQILYTFHSCSRNSNNTVNSWTECQIQCCPTNNPTPFSQSSLQECGGGNSSGPNSQILVIVLCVMVFIIITLLLACNRWKAYRVRLHMQKLEAALPVHQKGHLTISLKEEKWVEESNNPLDITETLTAPKQQQRNCSICLESKTTISLMCSHDFHQDCAVSWFKKNLSCPMCRTEVHFLRIRCEKMCNRYLLMRWEDYSQIMEELNKICNKCFDSEKELTKKEVLAPK